MNIYPAIKAKMGSWTYYVVRMTARELDESVKFAYDVYDDRTLSEAIQRVIREQRNVDIVNYLKQQAGRFFSSLVIAALKGDPQFYPVQITDEPQFAIFRNDRNLNNAFGVLAFNGEQTYYALDGQHRLKAIKTLLNRDDPLSQGGPPDFAKDEFSVIIVVPDRDDTEATFLQKYRRLFSNLNRYAKTTDQATNIIMDEDDAFAIVTRRLITEHSFFQWKGTAEKHSERIKTTKGKPLREGDSYFTSIESLYEVNTDLLTSHTRENEGWGPDRIPNVHEFKRVRPSDDFLDELYAELVAIWDALITEIPDLSNDPRKMRTHNPDPGQADVTDHLLFWPIGLEELPELVREKLRTISDSREPQKIKTALSGLGKLQWKLHEPPWRHFALIKDSMDSLWKLRNEDRKIVMRRGMRIQRWVLGLDDLDEDEILELKTEWKSMLLPPPSDKEVNELWAIVEQQRMSFE